MTTELEERLKRVYATAIKNQHAGSTIHIRVSSDVEESLKDFVTTTTGRAWGVEPATAWGFPIVVDHTMLRDSIAVHSVTTIY